MNAGPVLDALIAEKVMGWEAVPRHLGLLPRWYAWDGPPVGPAKITHGRAVIETPPFSTDIGGAYQVHDFMHGLPDEDERAAVYFKKLWRWDFYTADSATAAKWICDAALLAVGVEVPASV